MSEATKAALQAWKEFAMGVGLFAPSLRTMPAFTKVYDGCECDFGAAAELSGGGRRKGGACDRSLWRRAQ